MLSTKESGDSVSCSAISEDTRGLLAVLEGEIAMSEEGKIMVNGKESEKSMRDGILGTCYASSFDSVV